MIFLNNVANPEGPVCLPDGSWLFTEMDLGIISHVSADGSSKRTIAKTGLPNGLTVDGSGNIWVAEAKFPSLLKVSLSGDVTEFSRGNIDLPFLLPNDLCFGPDGAIYMTDSGILLEEMRALVSPVDAYNLSYDGRVFRIDPISGSCDLIDRGFRLTNGIAFGSRGNDLYVAETLTGNIYRYEIVDGIPLGEREIFANVMIKPPIEHGRVAGPDGMAFDQDGNLYVAVLIQGDITVIDPSGRVKERIKTDGILPTNLAFDRPGSKRLLVTEAEKNQLFFIETDREGLPLHSFN
jgi:gluconolactonase